jgi:CheY-like chemotaxis protein
MGGEIGVDAVPGGGSCFWFTLPAGLREQGGEPGEDAQPLKGLRVAVVTANRALREGTTLQLAASGAIADDPDKAMAVLIDAGTGNAPALAARPDPARPALVMLAPGARGSLAEMRALGFAGYLVKPVRQSSLVAQIAQCTQPARETAAGAEAPDFDPPAIAAPFLEDHPAATRGGAPADGRSLRVLLAEDNPINMMLLRELLRRRGHAVVEVTTGNQAVDAALGARFDLLLTDIHMPGMDGIEAARAIRMGEARMGRARTPIVALTADALEAGRQACLDAGMDGFLTKPVDPAELEEMLCLLFPGKEPSHIVAA